MDLAALAAIAGGADAEAVASAAREAEWRALNWTAEKLVLHAAQRAFVASHDALATTKQAAERLQNIARGSPNPADDSIAAVAATMCKALAEAGCSAEGQSPAPARATSPKTTTTTNTPTVWTPGLVVRPATATAKYAEAHAHIHEQNEKEEDEEDEAGDEAAAGKDGDEKQIEGTKQAQKKRRTLPVELQLMMPSLAGQSMPVVRTEDAKEIKALTKKQVTKAQREFPLVKGLPAPPKAPAPLLQLLRSGGFNSMTLDNIQTELTKQFQQKDANLRQDANTVLHILAHALQLAAAMRNKEEISEEKMQAIERDVYLVAMLQQQKLVANGEAMVDKICKCLHLPD